MATNILRQHKILTFLQFSILMQFQVRLFVCTSTKTQHTLHSRVSLEIQIKNRCLKALLRDVLVHSNIRSSVHRWFLGYFEKCYKVPGKSAVTEYFFMKVAGSWPAILRSKVLHQRCFSRNSTQIFRTVIFKATSEQQLLESVAFLKSKYILKVNYDTKNVMFHLHTRLTAFQSLTIFAKLSTVDFCGLGLNIFCTSFSS